MLALIYAGRGRWLTAEAEQRSASLDGVTGELAEARTRLEALEAERLRWREECAALRRTLGEQAADAKSLRENLATLRREADALRNTFTVRLRDRLLALPAVGGAIRLLVRLRHR